jgi:hypothetical protein
MISERRPAMFLAFTLGFLAISRPPQDASFAALFFVVESANQADGT